jgi:hypothetical protein
LPPSMSGHVHDMVDNNDNDDHTLSAHLNTWQQALSTPSLFLPSTPPPHTPSLSPSPLSHSLPSLLPHSLPSPLPHSLPSPLPHSLPSPLPHSLPSPLIVSLPPPIFSPSPLPYSLPPPFLILFLPPSLFSPSPLPHSSSCTIQCSKIYVCSCIKYNVIFCVCSNLHDIILNKLVLIYECCNKMSVYGMV